MRARLRGLRLPKKAASELQEWFDWQVFEEAIGRNKSLSDFTTYIRSLARSILSRFNEDAPARARAHAEPDALSLAQVHVAPHAVVSATVVCSAEHRMVTA